MKPKYFISTVLLLLSLIFVISYKYLDYNFEPQYEPTIIEPSSDLFSPQLHPSQTPTKTEPPREIKDQVGWIDIPGLKVNDPIVQTTDNTYYLTHNEYGEKSVWGAYFVHAPNNVSSASALDKVTIIYGHSNGRAISPKFAALKLFKNPEYAAKYQQINLKIGEEDTKWQIFAVGDYSVNNDYLIPNPDDDYFLQEIAQMKAASQHTYSGIDVGPDDKILILSTCTGLDEFETRYIVCAKKVSIN